MTIKIEFKDMTKEISIKDVVIIFAVIEAMRIKKSKKLYGTVLLS